MSADNKIDGLKDYIDAIGAIMVVLDVEGKVLLINRKGCEALGCSAEYAIGKLWIENFVSDRTKNSAIEFFERLKHHQSSDSEYYEGNIIDATGNERTIAWHSSVLRDIEGKIIATLNSGEDITERKAAEQQIENLARFPSEDPNPVLRISDKGQILYANPASKILLDEWGCEVGEYIPEAWYQYISRILKTGNGETLEIVNGPRTFSLAFTPIVDANYANVYGIDITEQKQTEENLRKYREYLEDIVKERTQKN